MTSPQLPYILIGAGGHGKVLLALAEALKLEIRGVCDPALAADGVADWNGVPVLGGDETLDGVDPAAVALMLGVGHIVRQDGRKRLYERFTRRGFLFPPLVHPAAWVAPTARLSLGVQVMAGVVVQPDCRIGENTIINTRASVDHDCRIGRYVHVAPGATLCGGVDLCDGAFIGAGATILQGVRVGQAAIVGAGTTLRRDLSDGECSVATSTKMQQRLPTVTLDRSDQ